MVMMDEFYRKYSSIYLYTYTFIGISAKYIQYTKKERQRPKKRELFKTIKPFGL
jgi:hypothetical protein